MKKFSKTNYEAQDEDDDNFEEDFVTLARGEKLSYTDNIHTNKPTLFARITDNSESSEYFKTIIRGFVWIFMFIVSLLAIFLIFKSPYLLYYEQVDPIVFSEQDKVFDNEYYPITKVIKEVGEDYDVGEIDEDFIRQNMQEYLPQGDTSEESSGSNVQPKEGIPPVAPTKDVFENQKDSALTQIIRNNQATVPSKNDKSPALNSIDNSVRENRRTSDLLSFKNSASNENTNNSNITKEQALGILALEKPEQDTSSTQVDNIPQVTTPPVTNNKPSELQSFIQRGQSLVRDGSENKPAPKATTAPTNTTSPVGRGWLVNLYSSTNQDNVHKRIRVLKAENPSLANEVFYIMVGNVNGNPIYRLGISYNNNTSKPHFSSSEEARLYCSSLKQRGLDCFINEVDLSTISVYKGN